MSTPHTPGAPVSWCDRALLALCAMSLFAYLMFSESMRSFAGEVTRLLDKM